MLPYAAYQVRIIDILRWAEKCQLSPPWPGMAVTLPTLVISVERNGVTYKAFRLAA